MARLACQLLVLFLVAAAVGHAAVMATIVAVLALLDRHIPTQAGAALMAAAAVVNLGFCLTFALGQQQRQAQAAQCVSYGPVTNAHSHQRALVTCNHDQHC